MQISVDSFNNKNQTSGLTKLIIFIHIRILSLLEIFNTIFQFAKSQKILFYVLC